MKAADGGKARARKGGPSAKPSGLRPNPKYSMFNPLAELDSNQMQVRPPGHNDHHRRGKPL